MSFRTYAFIGLIIGGIVLLIGVFFGENIYIWAGEQETRAALADVGGLGTLVMAPVQLMFNPDFMPFGAILAGVLWPLTLLWPLVVLANMVIVEGIGVSRDTEINR
jgi:hypothetical protein